MEDHGVIEDLSNNARTDLGGREPEEVHKGFSTDFALLEERRLPATRLVRANVSNIITACAIDRNGVVWSSASRVLE